MKVGRMVTQIYAEIERIQLNLDSRDNSQLRKTELLATRQGLELALEIVKNNM